MPLVTENEIESLASAARGMIFDMDGTLIDSEKYHARAFAQAMREVTGYTLSPEETEAFKGNTTLDYSAELGAAHGVDVDSQAVLARKMAILEQIYQPEFYPYAREFLDLWYGRLPLALATNSPRWFADKTLQGLKVRGVFDAVVTIDDVTERKPSPQMVMLCAERLGLPPADLLMFEDSEYGLQAGLAAGCRVILVDPDNPDRPQGATGPFPWEQLCRRLRGGEFLAVSAE